MKKLVLICFFILALASCKKSTVADNQFFFPKGTETVTYNALIDTDGETATQVVTARLSSKGRFMDGELYELVFDAPVGDLLKLGDFYVDSEKIYKVNPNDVQDMVIVCSNEDVPDRLGNATPGLHLTVSVNEERCHFISNNNLEEIEYFENIIWEKGIGLVEFTYGTSTNSNDISLEIVRN